MYPDLTDIRAALIAENNGKLELNWHQDLNASELRLMWQGDALQSVVFDGIIAGMLVKQGYGILRWVQVVFPAGTPDDLHGRSYEIGAIR